MIILFALLLLKDGYISVYFVDLKAHEESQRSWLGKACWGCLFSLTDGDDLNSTYLCLQTPTRAALRLCAFRPVVFLSVPPVFEPQLLMERAKGGHWWQADENLPFPGVVGEPVAITLHRKHRLVRCWQWQRHEPLALLSLDVKSRRGKGSAPHSLTAVSRTRPPLQGHTDWAWGFQQCP